MTITEKQWLAHLSTILTHGLSVSCPRLNTETLECSPLVLTYDTLCPVIRFAQRKLNYEFMAEEACMILRGDNRLAQLAQHIIKMVDYSDDGMFLAGAYGPKLIDQLPYAIKTTSKDPLTRQCVISLWRERPYESKDIPCTLTLQFLQRNGHINLIVNMRSSDAWIGLPYDLFFFAMILRYFVWLLGKKYRCGTVSIMMGSAHIYGKDINSAYNLTQVESIPREDWEEKMLPIIKKYNMLPVYEQT